MTQIRVPAATPEVLQGFAAGQLANRLQRSIRLWWWVDRFYGSQPNWSQDLPNTFGYPLLRDRLFAASHPKQDHSSADHLNHHCGDGQCLCHRTSRNLLFSPKSDLSEPQWCDQIQHYTGLKSQEIQDLLSSCPFATVHRSLRDDLKHLAQLGWLTAQPRGKFQCVAAKKLPKFATLSSPDLNLLTQPQIRQILPILESISFVQPNLELVIEQLWDYLISQGSQDYVESGSDGGHTFIHLDYILPPDTQDRVDTYQEQLEQLWRLPSAGVIQFEYQVTAKKVIPIITYPVCLHYVRRAKYLSAYGIDPYGRLNWHNYRLDRIESDRLTILAWGDPQIPSFLKQLRRNGELPQADVVRRELDRAWGFNFYLPRSLLLMRFPSAFAQRYVDNTLRHPTFKAISYADLIPVITEAISDPNQQQEVLQVLRDRSPEDAYYRGWIREGDINVLMRLRDWRPNGEVILPLDLRRKMAQEAQQELRHYQRLD
ncbi:TIGR03985 family CRISPR-associated protein [Geitlerinema sp. P-1104]|uniref:TIGR03985 family CRISPR-associated protein n=1 Tax=Geitlerinema sp. P-1104 TaxID=2546230 RepID=UPI001476EE3C|nr:TIGR03985 family CRISPR-associated protein [Geitlerinema sp. P-1104]NMG57328.1 TIGR03985 family CRISPR-associated protein [Geitlerinema sp. P-1104]